MIIYQPKFVLLTAFWIVIIASQYYFLYKKFESVKVCREAQKQVDVMRMQMDKSKDLRNGLKL